MIRIRLSTLLGEKRWTQADLARRTGIRANTINDYYHEMTDRVNLAHLDKICEVLGCDLYDLIKRVPDEASSPEAARAEGFRRMLRYNT